MTVKDIIKNSMISPDSIIILTRCDKFRKFLANGYPKYINPDEEGLNVAEFIAEDVAEGGKYYSLIKDLTVEEVIPFEGDWDEENYAFVINESEDTYAKIRDALVAAENYQGISIASLG